MDEAADLPTQDLQTQELEILTNIMRTFQAIPQESRRRVIDLVCRFFDLDADNVPSLRSATVSRHPEIAPSEGRPGALPKFSEDRSITPKQFMFQKQAKTDVEKVACLAYYLTHYRDTPFFKTLDISKLNTEAAQIKFSNPTVAVDNAAKLHYLVPATKGNKQLSSLGEQFVLALPDRDAAREVMANSRPRKRTRKENSDSQGPKQWHRENRSRKLRLRLFASWFSIIRAE